MNYWNTKRDGVKIRILETGEEFNSITACANYLGVNASWLGKVARGNDNLCTVHGYHIVRVDDPRLNYDIYRTEYRGRRGKKVQIVETGEIFDSITECAKFINGSPATIHDILCNKRNRVTHKGFHFKSLD